MARIPPVDVPTIRSNLDPNIWPFIFGVASSVAINCATARPRIPPPRIERTFILLRDRFWNRGHFLNLFGLFAGLGLAKGHKALHIVSSFLAKRFDTAKRQAGRH